MARFGVPPAFVPEYDYPLEPQPAGLCDECLEAVFEEQYVEVKGVKFHEDCAEARFPYMNDQNHDYGIPKEGR
jgi:hypothetical protein